MRVLPSTIAIAVLAFALTGCTSTPEDAFMSDLRADTPSILDRGTQDEAVELAHLVCDSMTRGDSAHENAAMLEGIGWSVAEAGTFVIAAVENFCPEHDALIR